MDALVRPCSFGTDGRGRPSYDLGMISLPVRPISGYNLVRFHPARLDDPTFPFTARPSDRNTMRIIFPVALLFGLASSVSADEPVSSEPVSFELQVQPILAARGCSVGACHGKARGQNGFQLSLLGFDSDFDHAAVTRNARGRRVFTAAPDQSLLLLKATAVVPHGGGQRIARASEDYRLLREWIARGAPRRLEQEPKLVRVEVSHTERTMKPKESQPLFVTAHYSNGTARDVTGMTMFQSNESALVAVNQAGVIQAGPIPGEATIMARYMNVFAICNAIIPLPEKVPEEVYAKLPRYNFIDGLVWNKLQLLGITPAEPVDDARFLRRAYLDAIGSLPTPDETRAYLADTATDKRVRLVDRLLERSEYAELWANKWVDLLRPNPYRVGIKAVLNYDYWIRDSFRRNKPYDQFVREIITAQGSTWHNGAATFFRDRREPDEITSMVSQLFLGIRLECAKCHHHPFEKWGQEDYFGLAAYFARVGHKGAGLSPPISGGEEMVIVAKSGQVKHPITGETLPPKPLFGAQPTIGEGEDPRAALADWLTSPENHFFAEVAVNRVWADLMGHGIVEPIDDLRATNPPTNAPLLRTLAEDFRRQKYDFKQLIRTVMTSYVYGLSSGANPRNSADNRNFSRHYRTRLRAEVLHDAVCEITGVPTKFSAMPIGSRATEIWTHRIDSTFLDTFGRPDPNRDPPCERIETSTVTQVLHLMNATTLHQKIASDDGRAKQLASSPLTSEQIVEELYLRIYCRFPDVEERKLAAELFAAAGADRRQVVEDLMWALTNTPEFVFKD